MTKSKAVEQHSAAGLSKRQKAYLNQLYNKLEECRDCNETGAVYKKIHQILRDYKPKNCEIKKDDGTIVWDSQRLDTLLLCDSIVLSNFSTKYYHFGSLKSTMHPENPS